MKYILFLYLLLSSFILHAQKLSEVGYGYSRTSVNTTVFRTNSLVTHDSIQFIAFYDDDEFLVIGKRLVGNDTWQTKRSQYKGNCRDAHNIISIMTDGDGYLHVSFDHHGHPLNYCKSLEPFSLDLGEKIPMLGEEEENVTYPEFYKLNNGNLLFVYRSGSSGRGNLVINQYDITTKHGKEYRMY